VLMPKRLCLVVSSRSVRWQPKNASVYSGVTYLGGGDGANAPFGLTVNFWIIFALFQFL